MSTDENQFVDLNKMVQPNCWELPNGRISAIAASLANHPPITPVELLRCDPLTYDAVAAHLAAAGVRLENDTRLEFAICNPPCNLW